MSELTDKATDELATDNLLSRATAFALINDIEFLEKELAQFNANKNREICSHPRRLKWAGDYGVPDDEAFSCPDCGYGT